MASKQKRNSRTASRSGGGSTLFGILFGLILGLAAAAAVAYFVTQVPMPFVDKASRSPAQTLLPDVRNAPDPNLGLYGSRGGAGQVPSGPTVTAPTPLPDTAPAVPPQDEIGALLATLDPIPQAVPAQPKPAPKPATPAAQTTTTYLLQAGAFRNETDAQSVQARILMMGLPVQVQPAQVNGTQWYRVRVGPFKGIDDMNRSRMTLSEAQIESTVVRP